MILTYNRQYLSCGDGIEVRKLIADLTAVDSSAFKTNRIKLHPGPVAASSLQIRIVKDKPPKEGGSIIHGHVHILISLFTLNQHGFAGGLKFCFFHQNLITIVGE